MRNEAPGTRFYTCPVRPRLHLTAATIEQSRYFRQGMLKFDDKIMRHQPTNNGIGSDDDSWAFNGTFSTVRLYRAVLTTPCDVENI